MNIEKEAASCRDALMNVLAYADLRKQLADDEHRDPLPIYGAARMLDRIPLAMVDTPSERAVVAREYYNIPIETVFNEEGC